MKNYELKLIFTLLHQYYFVCLGLNTIAENSLSAFLLKTRFERKHSIIGTYLVY